MKLDRSKIWSLEDYAAKRAAFRALAGRPPFAGKSVADVYRAAMKAARPKLTEFRPELRADVDDWVEIALSVDPEGRFMTVRALLNALTAALGLPLQIHRNGPRA